jgi:hypothetical protein
VLPEAGLFVAAQDVLCEVLGRIRPADREVRLPPVCPGVGEQTLGEAVVAAAAADAALVRLLTGTDPPGGPGTAAAARVACAAARSAADGSGPLLLRATLERALLAHYVAAVLGSTACPLTEELARPLWEQTAAGAAQWRGLGYFRPPMPLPEHVSWRDRFLLCAGHEPHPLPH